MFEPTVTIYSRTGEVRAKVPAPQRLQAIAIPRPKPSLMSERNAAELFGVLVVFAIYAAILIR